jgi:hypothetical protein
MKDTTITLDAKLKAKARADLKTEIELAFEPMFARLRKEFYVQPERIDRKPSTRFAIRAEKRLDGEQFYRVDRAEISTWDLLEEARRMLILTLTGAAEAEAVDNFLRDFKNLQGQVQYLEAQQ